MERVTKQSKIDVTDVSSTDVNNASNASENNCNNCNNCSNCNNCITCNNCIDELYGISIVCRKHSVSVVKSSKDTKGVKRKISVNCQEKKKPRGAGIDVGIWIPLIFWFNTDPRLSFLPTAISNYFSSR